MTRVTVLMVRWLHALCPVAKLEWSSAFPVIGEKKDEEGKLFEEEGEVAIVESGVMYVF